MYGNIFELNSNAVDGVTRSATNHKQNLKNFREPANQRPTLLVSFSLHILLRAYWRFTLYTTGSTHLAATTNLFHHTFPFHHSLDALSFSPSLFFLLPRPPVLSRASRPTSLKFNAFLIWIAEVRTPVSHQLRCIFSTRLESAVLLAAHSVLPSASAFSKVTIDSHSPKRLLQFFAAHHPTRTTPLPFLIRFPVLPCPFIMGNSVSNFLDRVSAKARSDAIDRQLEEVARTLKLGKECKVLLLGLSLPLVPQGASSFRANLPSF